MCPWRSLIEVHNPVSALFPPPPHPRTPTHLPEVPRLASPTDLAVTLPKSLFTSIHYHMTQIICFYYAKHITELDFVAIGWLLLLACLIALVQCNFLDRYFTSLASGLLSKVNWRLTVEAKHLNMYIYFMMCFFSSCFQRCCFLSLVFSAVSTSHTWLNRSTL